MCEIFIHRLSPFLIARLLAMRQTLNL